MSNCRGCSAPIEWAKSPLGSNLPLSAVSSLTDENIDRYGLEVPDPLPAAHRYFVKHGAAVKHPEGDMISHFIICCDRSKFTGGKR